MVEKGKGVRMDRGERGERECGMRVGLREEGEGVELGNKQQGEWGGE